MAHVHYRERVHETTEWSPWNEIEGKIKRVHSKQHGTRLGRLHTGIERKMERVLAFFTTPSNGNRTRMHCQVTSEHYSTPTVLGKKKSKQPTFIFVCDKANMRSVNCT